MNQGLRERQKASRRKLILDVAKKKFQIAGYSNVTIEEIANQSDLSAVTVYNYFGSKAGILLELVSESDIRLIQELDELIQTPPKDLITSVSEFGQILRQHAMSYLKKSTWREVVSASIHEGSREFGKTYAQLDDALIKKMEELILALQSRRHISAEVDTTALADCLFSMQNARFVQFIANDAISNEESGDKLLEDLISLQIAFESIAAVEG